NFVGAFTRSLGQPWDATSSSRWRRRRAASAVHSRALVATGGFATRFKMYSRNWKTATFGGMTSSPNIAPTCSGSLWARARPAAVKRIGAKKQVTLKRLGNED